MNELRRRFVLVFFAFAATCAAAQTCHAGQGQQGIAADVRDIRATHNCGRAYALYNRCLWGSSADVDRAEAVESVCRAELPPLSASQKVVYKDKLGLCGALNSPDGGTIQISENATCGLDVLVQFVTDPVQASQPVPRASFNCALARKPIELTICGNSTLGRADYLMGRAFRAYVQGKSPAERAAALRLQRDWNAAVPSSCGLQAVPASSTTVACLTHATYARAKAINDCLDSPESSCLSSGSAQ